MFKLEPERGSMQAGNRIGRLAFLLLLRKLVVSYSTADVVTVAPPASLWLLVKGVSAFFVLNHAVQSFTRHEEMVSD